MSGLYDPETEEESRRNDEAELALSTVQSLAEQHLAQLLEEFNGDKAKARWAAWERFISPVADRYSDRGASDTVVRDGILESLEFALES
mmetsp:Transcript_9632/g.29701  ORF Transcript_9632/g.29701 Transcript_9632/m.29701 type:complete len:89 (-) Transcript_9632:101-367(-)|eukprot:CAMPEP_0177663336 /NCGR_PEP_ID=MMETSP0447-20121125/19854_1 /TAXON_ID=0 /ORGANISM="Stygamoeba regulata, Strain BSH-02190019" /LENGTH=88 /DNA_ID=CAMNT_0019169131 /DNA_START=90 /DNA_END=356 /DNA_ORIENTATION=-